MHRVKVEPDENKVEQYKEECANPKCTEPDKATKGRTTWLYGPTFTGPVCKFCRKKLEGRTMVKWAYDRVKYHLEA